MKIAGKVTVVVGGARGIGRAYCEALLAKGAKVVMGDILKDLGEQTVAGFVEMFGEGCALFHHCDNTNDDHINTLFEKAVSHFGVPEIFVHNAAIIHEYKWENCLNVNTAGMIKCTAAALKLMSKANNGPGGVVVTTASGVGITPAVWGPVYSATKWATVGFTLSWGLPENVAVTGVRFNCICPMTVDTPFLNFIDDRFIYHADAIKDMVESNEKLMPSFVAEALVKLVEDDSLSSKAMRVTSALGHDFAEFQGTPVQ